MKYYQVENIETLYGFYFMREMLLGSGPTGYLETGICMPDILVLEPEWSCGLIVSEDLLDKLNAQNFNWINHCTQLELHEYDNIQSNYIESQSRINLFYIELIDPKTLSIQVENDGTTKIALDKKLDVDVFVTSNIKYCIVSEKFKEFIDQNAKDCLSFKRVFVYVKPWWQRLSDYIFSKYFKQ